MTNGTITLGFKVENIGGGMKQLALDAEAFKKVISETVAHVEKLKSPTIKGATLSTILTNATNALNQLNGVLQSVTGEYADFSSAMRAANTMAGKSGKDLDDLKDRVSELGKTIPIARDELANGLYQVVSNGVPEDNWISFLEASARSAVGGIADLGQTVNVTSTIIKNYGLEWSAARDIQDKIQLTAKNGVTSFEQLAQALPRVSGNAATLGVTIDELMATFATLTGVSGNTAEVSTQLAAIFTALVKPSSEATKMAAQMGIQFDAAAIKAAGGFNKFLEQLNVSVKAFAASSGMLEQEIYGKLFGSAESLRAMGPLVGNLSAKFTENVAAMADSAGVMDEAFDQMNQGGDAWSKTFMNKIAGMTDGLVSFLTQYRALINVGAQSLSVVANISIVAQAVKNLGIWQGILWVKTKALNIAFAARAVIRNYAAGIMMLSKSANTATLATTALKVALRGLLIASGIGIVIWALSEAIACLSSSSGKAVDTTNKLLDAEARAKRDAEQLQQLREQETSTLTDTRAELELNISKLKSFNGTKEQEINLVNQMNNSYGETMGYFSTVADWYKALTSNSRAYCQQMIVEARTRMLANQIAEKEQENHNLIYDDEGNKRTYSTKRATEQYITGTFSTNSGTYSTYATREVAGSSDLEKAQAAVNSNNAAIANLRNQMEESVNSLADIKFDVKGSKVRPNLGNSQPSHSTSATREQTEMQRLSAEIEKKKEQYTTASDADRQTLRSEIEGLETRKAALQNLLNEAGRPLKLDSESDFDKELQYLRGMRSQAAQEELAGYDARIKEVEQKRREFAEAAHKPVPLEKIDTYEALSAELDYYSGKLQYATAAEREEIRKQINALNSLKEQWDTLLDGLDSPGPVETLDTLGKIEKAVSYVDARIQQASGNELAALERQKNAYEAKRRAMMRTVELTDMRDEADRIDGLSGKSRRREISAIGYDGLTDKISELRRQLDDVKNPVTDEQRRDIESLIETYEMWRRESIDTWGTMRRGYGEIKNVGSAITGITDAIDGNGNAWEKLTGIVNGFLQLFDGIKAIVDIINLMTAATKQHTTAKQTETAVTVASTGATVADTAATETDIGVKSGDAIANATKSGAALPFPLNLVAIAAGVAAVIGALAMIGSFSTGGIVGGSSPQGDRLLARVNSGEMILNKAQQTRLYNALNGNGHLAAASAAVNRGAVGEPQIGVSPDVMRLVVAASRQPVVVGGTMRVSGRDLVCTLANETRIASRSGRRTGIRL